jgi:sporulation integral membrane protein YlbJ
MTAVKTTKKWTALIIPILIVLFNLSLLINPAPMIAAARAGLLMWFNDVLPALLPFAVGINILAGLGFVRFVGKLLSPLMRALFNVPGAGAFAWIAGLTSGYPMGARAAALLRKEKKISRAEAQRLMAFCNNAGPLFVVGFVGVGLFGSAKTGYLIWFLHIAASVLVGIIFRFVWRGGAEEVMLQAEEETEGFGTVLGQSVQNAMETMLVVGGYIILFSVASEMIKSFWIAGAFLEVANGARLISGRGVAATAAVISFGGFSVHAQAAHFIRSTDIRMAPYIFAKILQGVITYLLSNIYISTVLH